MLARHRAFLARVLRGTRSALQIGPVQRHLRRVGMFAPALHARISLHADLRRSVLAPTSVLRLPGQSGLRIAHTIWRHETRHVERVASTLRERLLRRLDHQPASTQRIHAAEGAWPTPRTVQPMLIPPVPRTMVRTPAAAGSPDRTQAPGTRPPLPEHRVSAPTRVAAAAFGPLPADELSRVTEHVLRTLDRRVLSYRERNGLV